jgi:hypothetical protein
LSVNDLERIIDEIGTACWAREARITPVMGQAALVWVDIIRRDPLGATRPLSPPVVDHIDTNDGPTWRPTPQRWPDSTPADTSSTPTTEPIKPTVVPPPNTNGTATNGTATDGAAKNGAARNGAGKNAPGTGPGAQADPPGVTGFGGVDVTDYV